MRSLSSILLLPPALLALLPLATADPNPTAIRKLSPDSNEKLFPEHLAFAPLPDFSAGRDSPSSFAPLEDIGDELDRANSSKPLYRRAFAAHYDETHEGMLRRAAEALAILEQRSSCPSGMNSCEDVGMPNKCCQEDLTCKYVPDTDVGHVACCPKGSDCGGGIGRCPAHAVSCPSDLGGGCCISGYICEGVGCVRAPSTTASHAPPETETTTEVPTTTEDKPPKTTTTEESTAIVTETGSETGGAPWRPTMSSGLTQAPGTDDSGSQTGCPTGFYGCLATHGGGCCRTDRNCETHSCPAPSSTTVVSGRATVVVPADNIPTTATATCADGWSLCGDSGGPTAGCCPNGYKCGTASCFTAEASQTEQVQKELPKSRDSISSVLRPEMLVLFSLILGGALFVFT